MLRLNRMVVALVLAAILIILFSVQAFADSAITTGSAAVTVPIGSAEFVIGMNQYFVNGQLPGIQMDAAPYIDSNSGRTLVPVRYLADALGAQINWDADTQTVTVSTAIYNIAMTIGSTTLTVNGQAQTMDVPPVINDGRTYLPARWVAQALGYNVSWDAANKIVVIYPESSIGEPGYNSVIQQAQQNAAQPEQAQKLDAALGITMSGSAANGGWDYNPEMNADGSPNIAWENQNLTNSFVVADVGSDGSIGVSVECATLADPSQITPDLSPLQKVLDAFFPGTDTSQAMAYARQCAANEQAKVGFNTLPADKLTINGMTVGVSQGVNGTTYAEIVILGN